MKSKKQQIKQTDHSTQPVANFDLPLSNYQLPQSGTSITNWKHEILIRSHRFQAAEIQNRSKIRSK